MYQLYLLVVGPTCIIVVMCTQYKLYVLVFVIIVFVRTSYISGFRYKLYVLDVCASTSYTC